MAQAALQHYPDLAVQVLIIEDTLGDAVLIEKHIHKAMGGGCLVRHARTLQEALSALGKEHYDIALLDLSLPDSIEFDGLLAIQNFAPKLPVIILTAHADEAMALAAVERGAQDYLYKDKTNGQAISRAMQYAIQRKRFEATLITQANFDTLTGLANRALFESRLDMALAQIQRSGRGLGVFFLDLNRFKQVNDTLGHAAGDLLLKQVAERLRQCVRPYDTAARFGGDEFALLIQDIAHPRDCAAIARKIIERIAAPFAVAHRKLEVGVSIGIMTCMADDPMPREMVLRHADEAMYEAKQSGQSRYYFYTTEIHRDVQARTQLEEELRTALAERALAVHYQPKIDLISGKTTGLEALLRWNHPTRGLLLPAEFMHIADDHVFSMKLSAWIISAVCSDLVRWGQMGVPPVPVSININEHQLDHPSFGKMLQGVLEAHKMTAQRLAVEIPAAALLKRVEERKQTLAVIHRLGVRIDLDHFGTSAVSLALLKGSPASAVKIAPELTSAIDAPNGVLPLVQAAMDIAGRFRMPVIATGIENDWQRAFFREHGCREGQGFALCRPIPSEFITDWLNESASQGNNY